MANTTTTTTDINPSRVSVDHAHAIAADFIRPYIERGDTPEQLTEGHMAQVRQNYSVQIGGCHRVFDKLHYFNRYRVVVTELDKQKCIIQFDIEKLIEEIRQPVKQMSLF